MEEKHRLLVCLGAAVAANCAPCFQHYYTKARNFHLTEEEIAETVEIGARMKTGAMMAMTNSIGEIMGGSLQETIESSSAPTTCCCG